MTETAQKPLRMTAREFVTCLYLMAASAKLTPRKPKQHRYVGGLIDTAGGVAVAYDRARVRDLPAVMPTDGSPVVRSLPTPRRHARRCDTAY
jgi:hypothetical protein